jgi:hypothetical protein
MDRAGRNLAADVTLEKYVGRLGLEPGAGAKEPSDENGRLRESSG